VSAAASTSQPASSSSSGATTSTSAKPASSSKKHPHDRITCSPSHVSQHGQCQAEFIDKNDPHGAYGQRVCFSVSPSNAGNIQTGSGHCATINHDNRAYAEFRASGKVCGWVTLKAQETGEKEQAHHTMVFIYCKKEATNEAALVPAGSPSSPAGGLITLMGMGLIAGVGYKVWRSIAWSVPAAS
jgi:hypothetical protein